jgi:hypothetical protein
MRPARLAAVLCLALAAALPARAQDAAPVAATLDADGVQRLAMTMGSYFYRPSHVVVTAGKPVEITLTAEEGFVPHDIVIDDAASGSASRRRSPAPSPFTAARRRPS